MSRPLAIQVGGALRVFATGVKDLSAYGALLAALQKTPKVGEVATDRWNKQSGLVVLEVRFGGTGEDLAVAVDNTPLSGKRRVVVQDFGPEQVDLSIR